jgi:aldehyde:ferredoxin oxidoreductase
MGGWTKRILWVDLTKGLVRPEALDRETCLAFLGTYGIGARLLYGRMRRGADPLKEENVLGLVAGPVAGTGIPCSSRFVAVGKSPLTLGWGDSNSGGHFGQALKRAGFDGLFFEGAASRPTYLFAHDGTGELRDAESIWGLDTAETDRAVRDDLNTPGLQVACIGPAGERLSRISGIVTDGGRIAARSGLGAVMGSKNLKAVAVAGASAVPVAHPSRLKAFRHKLLATIRDPDNLRMTSTKIYGTAGGMVGAILSNHCPVKNWKGVGARDFPSPERLDGDEVIAGKTKTYRCGGCALGCGALLNVRLAGQLVETHRPEYESLSAFGPLLLVNDLEAILHANHLCNLAGMDTISAGTAIAFAMECFERGLLSSRDLDGLDLHWGNAPAVIALLRMMIDRQGIGNLLADGAGWASLAVGEESRALAMTVGGEGLPMCDPRGTPGWATTYTVDATPARHMQGGSALPELGMGPSDYIGVPHHGPVDRHAYGMKGALAAETYQLMHAVNCSGICAFAPMSFSELADVLAAVTGHPFDYEELGLVGERVAVLRQAFNIREGVPPRSFTLPERVRGEPPLDDGPTAGVTIDLQAQNRSFYEAMQWDPATGTPRPERMQEIGGLEDILRDLHEAETE